jgi:hypothetical protein
MFCRGKQAGCARDFALCYYQGILRKGRSLMRTEIGKAFDDIPIKVLSVYKAR